MQLAAFITQALSFFASSESKLDALSKSQSEITDLRAQIATLNEKASGFEVKNRELVEQLDELQASAKTASDAHAKEITDLQSKLTAESRKANDVIAGQGIPAADLPALTPSNADAGKKLTATEECLAAKKKTLKK